MAFDKISEIDNKKFYSKLVYPTNIKEIVKEIAEHLAVSIKNLSELPDLIYKKVPENKSARVVLSEIMQLVGFNCFINRIGELEFKRYKEVYFELSSENAISFTLQSDELINISKLIAKDSSDKELEYGDDTGYIIELTTKKATDEILKSIYENIVKSYVPYEMECQGMPHIEVGDIIKYTNIDGEEFDILISEHKLIISGGLISEFSCEAIDDEGYTLGTLDDAYSDKLYGDTEEKMEDILENNIFVENEIDLEISTKEKILVNVVLSLKKDNTNATISFSACILSSEASQIELYMSNNGDEYPFKPKQTLVAGYNILSFTIPIIYLQDDIQNVFKIKAKLSNGTAIIYARQMQVIIKGSRLTLGKIQLEPFTGAAFEYTIPKVNIIPNVKNTILKNKNIDFKKVINNKNISAKVTINKNIEVTNNKIVTLR